MLSPGAPAAGIPELQPLVVLVGPHCSGKSTIAAALAADLGAAPGARIIASDRLRKRAFGQAATTRLPAEAYTPQVSERVYAEMAAEAAAALAAGALVDGLRALLC